MALNEVEGPAGAPWQRPPHGTLDRLIVESDLLADSPLGDPARRPLYVYRPPGVERDHPRPLPSVYVIQGYTGQIDMWFNRTWLDRRGSSGSTRCSPPATAPTPSSCSSTAGRATAARSSSIRQPSAAIGTTCATR